VSPSAVRVDPAPDATPQQMRRRVVANALGALIGQPAGGTLGARLRAMLFEPGVKAIQIDLEAFLGGHFPGQLDGETERVEHTEGHLARQRARAAVEQRGELALEHPAPLGQTVVKTIDLAMQLRGDHKLEHRPRGTRVSQQKSRGQEQVKVCVSRRHASSGGLRFS